MSLPLLVQTNKMLNISDNKRIIFVYSAPKVGSTSIVSSLRLFAIHHTDIIHIHDEQMMKVLACCPQSNSISINEIIAYNQSLGKEVYVINAYRAPIERKISAFFEKIGAFHFNVEDDVVNQYDVNKVIVRFNHLFPWIGTGDHFFDQYGLQPHHFPATFDIQQKSLVVRENGICYISLRLKDAAEWGDILTGLLGFTVRIIQDYESSEKPIKELYKRFKASYRIPLSFLNDVLENDSYFRFYYSAEERDQYRTEWLLKSTPEDIQSYTKEQYQLYENICLENAHIDRIQLDHYFDEGCTCKACNAKRCDVVSKLLRGVFVKTERIVHTEAKTQFLHKRVVRANKLNRIIRTTATTAGKNFHQDMTSIVLKKR